MIEQRALNRMPAYKQNTTLHSTVYNTSVRFISQHKTALRVKPTQRCAVACKTILMYRHGKLCPHTMTSSIAAMLLRLKIRIISTECSSVSIVLQGKSRLSLCHCVLSQANTSIHMQRGEGHTSPDEYEPPY